jgi:branched-chain amino acid transport system substrate-binding protein
MARRWAAMAFAGLLALAAAGCGPRDTSQEFGAVTVTAGRPLVVGVSVARTGDSSGDALQVERGVRLAVEEHGPVQRHPVEVVVRDDGCTAEGSLAAARDFIAMPDLLGVIGPMCSRGCVPASVEYDQARVLMVTPSCTASTLTNQGLETVFRVAWNGDLLGWGGGRYAAKQLKAKRVFALNDYTFYGKTLRDAFKVTLKDEGGRLVGDEIIDIGQTDFSDEVAQIRAARPDLVFYGGFLPSGRLLLEQMRAAGLTVPYMGGDTLLDREAFIVESGGAAEGAYALSAVPLRGKTYDDFARRFRDRWGDAPGTYAAEAYDATRALLNAADSSAERTRDALTIDRYELRQALLKTDLKGASGRLRFWPHGDRKVTASARVYQVRDGQFVLVKEETPDLAER